MSLFDSAFPEREIVTVRIAVMQGSEIFLAQVENETRRATAMGDTPYKAAKKALRGLLEDR